MAISNSYTKEPYCLSPPTLAALVAYSITGISALSLIRRASNRRIRFLAVSIGLLPLCEAVSILRANGWLPGAPVQHSIEMVQLAASAFALAAVHFLNRENRDRRNADMRLRLAESQEKLSKSGPMAAYVPRRPAPTLQDEVAGKGDGCLVDSRK